MTEVEAAFAEKAGEITGWLLKNYTMTFGVVSAEKAKGITETCALLEPMIADALLAAYAAGREDAATIVDGWHISKGGYTALAQVLRQPPTSAAA